MAACQQDIPPKLKPHVFRVFLHVGRVLVLLSCLATSAALPQHPSSLAGVDVMGKVGLQKGSEPQERS